MEKVIQALIILLLSNGLVFRFIARKHMTNFGKSLLWYNPKHWYIGYDGICKAYTEKGAKYKYYSDLSIIVSIGTIMLEKII